MDAHVGIEQINHVETQPIPPERKSGGELHNSDEHETTPVPSDNPVEIVERIDFCRQLLDSFSNKICSCSSPYNRNGNAFHGDIDGQQQQQQLYPHMRKFYNNDTDSLEHVRIVMSTIKPMRSIDEQQKPQDETLHQHPRRRTRVSKQRAQALITKFCRRKPSGDILTNKRKSSSLWFLLY